MAAILQKIRKTNCKPPSPKPVAKPTPGGAARGVVVVGAPWKVAFLGGECRGPENFACTKPVGHRGKHNGVCIVGKGGKCSTIYPHNPAEVHAWLSLRIICGDRVSIISPADLKLMNFDGLADDILTFLRKVHDFIFGDGSPMSRLWVGTVALRSKVGPRTRIVSALNGCFADTLLLSPQAALEKLILDCGALPWPPAEFLH